jgi:hypothetical protein
LSWPFSSVVAPNLNSGIIELPASNTLVTGVPGTGTALWLMGLTFTNTTDLMMTVSVTDGSDVALVSALEVPARDVVTRDFPFRPLTGLKWSASAASGLRGQAWGYY